MDQRRLVYLAVILDLYSRRVIGWAVSNRVKRDLAISALDMTVALRQPSRDAFNTPTADRNTAQMITKSA